MNSILYHALRNRIVRGWYLQARFQYRSQVTLSSVSSWPSSCVLWESGKQVAGVKQEIIGEAEDEVAKNQSDKRVEGHYPSK